MGPEDGLRPDRQRGEIAWDIGGGEALEIRRDREEAFEPFVGSFEELVRTCSDGELAGGRVVRPWFTPARPSQYIRLRFQGDRLPDAATVDAWCERQTQALGALLLDGSDSKETRSSPRHTRVLHVPRPDAVVSVHGVGGGTCWWSVIVSGAPEFPERDVRALIVSGGELGWPASAGVAFDAAQRDVRDWGY